MASADQSTSARAAGVVQALKAIERKFGAGAVQRLGDVTKPVTDVLPTGLVDLDRAIGIGGWPRGRICEVFGPESVGVSTLLLQTLAAAQQRGGVVALIDVDHTFVPEYARRIGCVVEEIYIAQPDDGPMALEIVDALVRSGAFDAVALDSVPGLYPSQRYDAESEPANDALDRARLLSEAMRRLVANIDRTRTVVLFGNRQTEKTSEDATPGGRALRFYSSVRLGMQRIDLTEDAFGTTGVTVKVTSVKNKVAPPLRQCELRLQYGAGFEGTLGQTAAVQPDWR
jgi:recombination protein RecA